MKKFSSASQKTGELGEDIVCRYLLQRDYTILERNYTQKWGEIDIVAQKGGIVHFIEVKSVSREKFDEVVGDFRPEDQMHPRKQKRLARAIQSYLISHEVKDWQFDLMCVYIDQKGKRARVKMMEDVILG